MIVLNEVQQLPPDLQFWADNQEIDGSRRQVYRSTSAQAVNRVLAEAALAEAAILEIGCGTGELHRQVNAVYHKRYIQTDINEHFLAVNRHMNPDGVLVQAAADHLPVADSTQDAVVAMNVLDIVPKPADVLQEVKRVLKPSGTFIHYHDRRPYMPFMISHIPEDQIPFPWVKDDRMEGFQLVSQSDFNRNPDPRLVTFAGAVRRDPMLIERSRNFMPARIDVQSELVDNRYGPQALRRPFGRVYNQAVAGLLKQAGFEVAKPREEVARGTLPVDCARYLGSTIGMSYSGENSLVKNANGCWRFISNPDLAAMPVNEVALDFTLNTVMAVKPMAR